ncbi:MAG: queuosine salvage family protein [Acidimicrobiales bacterium]
MSNDSRSEGICDQIRDRCRWVTEQATHVHIDHERLAAYAAEVPVDALGGTDDDPGREPLGDLESTASFVVSLDAINFGSGWFPTLRKRPGLSGYHTIATALREHVEATGPLTPERLTTIDRATCCEIFGQDDDDSPAAELMELFASAFSDLGAFLLERYDGSFLALIEDAGRSAEQMIGVLAQIPFFHDVSEYHGVDVPFYKRAQITPLDLSMAFGGTGPGTFDDLDRLTMFADNLVPHVLQVDGVLVYEPELLDRIGREELIAPGTPEEIEIRAGGVHAVELLRAALAADGHQVTSAQLDTYLWNLGGDPRYKALPRHRTRTVCY